MEINQNSIQVFLPSQKDPNPFLDEIISESECQFIFGDLNSYKPSYPVVLINWPEQIFNWKEPSNSQLEDLNNKLILWKKTARIIYVVHDLERHAGMTINYKRLFQIVLSNSDSLVHLGNYSLNLFKKTYPNKLHICIYHPLYLKCFPIYDLKIARQKLGIAPNKIVFIAPGRIRNLEERNFVINAFKRVKCKNKMLLVPNMFYRELRVEFKGRTLLKKIVDVKKIVNRIYNINLNPNFRFGYGFTPTDKLGMMMSASDIVIVPRLKILNSGNVFLALTYQKIIVGPSQGNVLEHLKLFNFPVFEPNDSNSIDLAFEKSIKLFKSENYKYDVNLLKQFSPKSITEKWDSFLSKHVIQSKY